MDSIEKDLLNIKSKIKLNVKSSESRVYRDDERLYKLYRGVSFESLNNKKEKINMLYNGGYILPSVVIPDLLILDKNMFVGIGEKYIRDSIQLYDYFDSYDDISNLLNILKRISLDLKKIHENPNDIIISDFHFDNVLLDKNYNHYIIDIDSCEINGIKGDRIPGLYENYLYSIRYYDSNIDKNTDKISFMLSTLFLFFNKNLEEISQYEYDELSEKLETFNNFKRDFKKLKKLEKIEPVEYFYDYISDKDINHKILLKNIK